MEQAQAPIDCNWEPVEIATKLPNSRGLLTIHFKRPKSPIGIPAGPLGHRARALRAFNEIGKDGAVCINAFTAQDEAGELQLLAEFNRSDAATVKNAGI